jgi:hypothetical protein
MARSTFKFHIDFDTDDGYLKGKSIDLPSSTPEISTFNRKDASYDRAKWEDFLIYDLKNEIQHRLHEYIESAVKDFLDRAEEMNADKSKKGKKK